MMRDFVDVEGELDPYMLVLALGVVDDWTVFLAKLGKLNGDGDVCGLRMTN
jgi:hypothetical protein